MNRRRRPQSSASFLAPAFAKVVVRLDQDPIEALLQQQERQLATNQKEPAVFLVPKRPIALEDSRQLVPHLQPIKIEEYIEPVTEEQIIDDTLTGFFLDDTSLILKLKRSPKPLRRFLVAVQPSLSSLDMFSGQDISPRRRALLKLAQRFESSHSFGHMIGRKYFERSQSFFFALPEMYIACGAYGATFTGIITDAPPESEPVERVILKVAWDDADAIQSFAAHGRLDITTAKGVKPFDRSVIREAIVTRQVSRIAQLYKLPVFSLYSVFAYLPLSIENVLVETAFGSGSFASWTKSDRQSYPSVLKTPQADQSLFLPQAPPPRHLQASITLQEMSYETLSSFMQGTGALDWTLEHVKELVTQVTLAVVSYQRALGVEHGDLHMSNLMVVPDEKNTQVVVYESANAWPITRHLRLFVRFIDWGFARSDLLFGHGDIRTCLSIESEKRLYLTRGILFPCEFHDVACFLSEMMNSTAKLGDSARARLWLQQAWEKLTQKSVEWMGWNTMEEGTRAVETTGIYPLKISDIEGTGLVAWLADILDDTLETDSNPSEFASPTAVYVELPQQRLKTRPAPPGTSLASVLQSVLDREPFVLPTDAPLVHERLMRQLCAEARRSLWRPLSPKHAHLESEAMEEFFSVQVYSYHKKRAITLNTMVRTWEALRQEPNMKELVERFVSKEDMIRFKALNNFFQIAGSHGQRKNQFEKMQHVIEELAAVDSLGNQSTKSGKLLDRDDSLDSFDSDSLDSFDSDSLDSDSLDIDLLNED